MGFIRQKADRIIVKKQSPKTHYGKLYNGKQHEDGRRESGLGLVLTYRVAFQLLSFPEVWKFQFHRTCCSGLRSLGDHLLGPNEEN